MGALPFGGGRNHGDLLATRNAVTIPRKVDHRNHTDFETQ